MTSARGFCLGCYCRWWRANRRDASRRRFCLICGDPHHARGWCRSHYLNWKFRGDPLAYPAARPKATIVFCNIEGCPNLKDRRDGMCEKHHQRWVRHGDPLVEIPVGRPATRLDIPEDIRHKASAVAQLWRKGIKPTAEQLAEYRVYARMTEIGRVSRTGRAKAQ